jgi:hypothetical protein
VKERATVITLKRSVKEGASVVPLKRELEKKAIVAVLLMLQYISTRPYEAICL